MSYEPENLSLRQLRGMRAEMEQMRESQISIMKTLARLEGLMLTIRSDVAHLEIQATARHGDVLNLMRRLDDAEIPEPL